MLMLVQNVFYGQEGKKVAGVLPADLSLGETATLVPLVVLMLAMGLAPAGWLWAVTPWVHSPSQTQLSPGQTLVLPATVTLTSHPEVLR